MTYTNQEIYTLIAKGLREQGSLGASGLYYDRTTYKYCAIGAMDKKNFRDVLSMSVDNPISQFARSTVGRQIMLTHDSYVILRLGVEDLLDYYRKMLSTIDTPECFPIPPTSPIKAPTVSDLSSEVPDYLPEEIVDPEVLQVV